MQDGIIIGLVMAVVYMGSLFIYHFFNRYFEIKNRKDIQSKKRKESLKNSKKFKQ